MNDIREIDYFLKLIKASAEQGMIINKKMVYANLVRMGIKPARNSAINHNFSDWIENFRRVPNIDVYVQANWQYFCQFNNDDSRQMKVENMIKMYIPIDDSHINEAAKRIFSFMARSNMIHHSKIGSEVRFDDIVIRIDSEENAKKIEKFIMSDPYIMSGMMKPNPFAFNNGYISYAWDGDLSFNTVISEYISNYINELKNNHQLHKVSYKDFVKYLNQTYNDVFVNKKNISKYSNLMNIDNQETFINYQKVTELLIESIMPDKKNKDFFDIYRRIVYGSETKKTINGNKTERLDRPRNIEKYRQAWNDIYDLMVKKYGNEISDDRILMFIQSGNYRLFTRENNIREYIMSNNLTPEIVKELYLSMNKMQKKREILFNASADTYNKYGYEQLKEALKRAVGNDYGYFTNRNGGRDMMGRNIKSDEIHGLIAATLLENGIDLTDKLNNREFLYNEYIKIIENVKKNNYRR